MSFVDELRADVIRLARLTDTGEPFAVFLELRRVRDPIYRLLDRRPRPREQTDLFFLLACLNGIMGIAANRLGYPDAAEELERAGWAYANAIDHHPLMAKLRGELSVFAYYRGRFEQSRDLALSGLQYFSAGPEGPPCTFTMRRQRPGSVMRTRPVRLSATRMTLTTVTTVMSCWRWGGTFAVSRATHYAMSGSALTAILGAEPEADAELERAVGMYDEGPGPGEDHWVAGKPLAGIELRWCGSGRGRWMLRLRRWSRRCRCPLRSGSAT
jgi:hypothetical protein